MKLIATIAIVFSAVVALLLLVLAVSHAKQGEYLLATLALAVSEVNVLSIDHLRRGIRW